MKTGNKTLDWFITKLSGPALSFVFHILLIMAMVHFFTGTVIDKPQNPTVIVTTAPELPDIDPEPDIPEDIFDLQTPPVLIPPDITQPELVANEPVVPDDTNLKIDFKVMDSVSNTTTVDTGNRTALRILSKQFGDNRLKENGLFAIYFDRIDYFGEAHTRIDKTVNIPLSRNSPWPGKVKGHLYSIIWSGRITPKVGGEYTFYLSSDDGARFWLDGELIINQFNVQATKVATFTKRLYKGHSYDLLFAFNQHHGPSESRLEWAAPGQGIQRQLIPTDCLWADSTSSLQLLSWLNNRPTDLAQHIRANPVIVNNQPMSHVLSYPKLTETHLKRIKLDEYIPFWEKIKNHAKAIDVNPAKKEADLLDFEL